MWLIDAFSLYLYGLKYLALALAVIILVSGLDDLFIDVVYWLRRVWRALTVYGRHKRFDPKTLHQLDEKPLAIMVPVKAGDSLRVTIGGIGGCSVRFH